MDLDPEDVFKDDDDDEDSEFFHVQFPDSPSMFYCNLVLPPIYLDYSVFLQLRDPTKEFAVYLIDASPKMFSSTCPGVSLFFLY